MTSLATAPATVAATVTGERPEPVCTPKCADHTIGTGPIHENVSFTDTHVIYHDPTTGRDRQFYKKHLRITWAHTEGLAAALPAPARVLLTTLADHAAFDTGHVEIDHQRISTDTQFSHKTIRRLVKRLLDAHLIEDPWRAENRRGQTYDTHIIAARTIWGLIDHIRATDAAPDALHHHEQQQLPTTRQDTVSERQVGYIQDLVDESGRTWQEAKDWLRDERGINLIGIEIDQVPKNLASRIISSLHRLKQARPKPENPERTPANRRREPLPLEERPQPEYDGPTPRIGPPQPEAQAIWDDTLRQMRSELSEFHYTVYLSETSGSCIVGNELRVEVSSLNILKDTRQRFQRTLNDTVRTITGRSLNVVFALPAGHTATRNQGPAG